MAEVTYRIDPPVVAAGQTLRVLVRQEVRGTYHARLAAFSGSKEPVALLFGEKGDLSLHALCDLTEAGWSALAEAGFTFQDRPDPAAT